MAFLQYVLDILITLRRKGQKEKGNRKAEDARSKPVEGKNGSGLRQPKWEKRNGKG